MKEKIAESDSILPGPPNPPPPPDDEMHQMGLRLIEMGLELLRSRPYRFNG